MDTEIFYSNYNQDYGDNGYEGYVIRLIDINVTWDYKLSLDQYKNFKSKQKSQIKVYDEDCAVITIKCEDQLLCILNRKQDLLFYV
jgi:hypothetical protein